MIDYTEPRNYDEWVAAQSKHIQLIGTGAETATIFCCPFCTYPNFSRVRITHTNEDMSRPRTCQHCGRVSCFLVGLTEQGGVAVEVVQFAGAEPQDFIRDSPSGAPRWFLGCPVWRVEDKVTRQEVSYLTAPRGSYDQVVCTWEFNHTSPHSFVPISSAEGYIARNNFRE